MADDGSSEDTSSATLASLTSCVGTVVANDLSYALCLTRSGLFGDLSSNASASGSSDGTCRLMCTEPTMSASASCCAATAALRACETTSSAVTACKTLFDTTFTYQYECEGLSTANVVLIVIAVVAVSIVAAITIVSRLQARRKQPQEHEYQLHAPGADENSRVKRLVVSVTAQWRQITNLVWKNLVIRRRKPVSLVMEQFLPVLLASALVLLANLDSFSGDSDVIRTSEAADESSSTLMCTSLAVSDWESFGGPTDTMTSFYTGGQSVLGLFFLVSYIKFVSTTTTTMVIEKENRLREVMKIMGLSDTTLLSSWCLTSALLSTPLALALAAELKYGNVFPTTEYATLVLVFWTLSLAIAAFSYFVSPFFNKSRTAAITSVLVWLLLFFPFFAVQPSTSNAQKYWAALAPPTAFALAIDDLLRHAQLGTGFAYSIGLQEEPITVPTAVDMSLFLILDSVLLVALGWYLEQVIPQQFGVSRPWNFLFKRSFWADVRNEEPNLEEAETLSDSHMSPASTPQAGGDYTQLGEDNDQASKISNAPGSSNPFVEPVSATLAAQERNGTCLQLRGLRKVFPLEEDGEERVAVAGLDLAMYSGQITALLGHNGAGKTTIISMLTGLIPPTSGDATLYGCSIQKDFQELRRVIGICPQHDVLFLDLTVEEHLLLFGTMKNVPHDQLQHSVDEMIESVGLTETRHSLAKTLSGGQKRKLSVALAFLGGSKLVFLDEPTSGMDPYSRRFTWNLLQQSRGDRVIVLTTHFMDEADILGDRIAILSEGQLRCAGSSLFLKSRFGAGYNLTMIKTAGGACDPDAVGRFLRKYVPDAKCLSSSGSELVFQLPTASSKVFPDMLEQLDNEMKQLGIQQYGISVTTLEEVFLRIARDRDEEEHNAIEKEAEGTDTVVDSGSDTPPTALERKSSTSGSSRKSLKLTTTETAVNMSPTRAPRPPITEPTMWTQYSALTKKRFQIAKRDKKTLANSVGIPLVFLIILAVLPQIQVANFVPNYASGLPTEAQQSQCTADTTPVWGYDEQSCEAYTFDYCSLGVIDCDASVCCDASNYESPWYPCNTCVLTEDTEAERENALWSPCYNSKCLRKNNAKLQVTLNGFLVALVVMLGFTFVPAAIVAFLVREKDPNQNSKGLQLISGANVSAYWLASWTHDMLLTLVPIIAAIIIVPIAMTSGGSANATVGEVVAVALLVITHIWAVIPLAYLFSRRFSKHAVAQTALLVFGLGTGGLLSIFSFLCRVVDFRLSGSFTLSALDRNYFRWIFMFFPGYSLNSGVFELATRKLSRRALFGSGRWILTLPSFFGLFEGLGKADCDECWDAAVLREYGLSNSTSPCCIRQPFDLEVAGAPLMYAALEAVVLAVLVFVLENRAVKWNRARTKVDDAHDQRVVNVDGGNESVEDVEDEDVALERRRVEQEPPRPSDRVFIRNLHKQYAGKPRAKVALKDLCLAIPSGECFGYLGINGAGKSTTMAVVTGQLAPTRGFVTLSGFDLSTSSTSARKVMGYCPQFDALHDLLTVAEQLQLYARLKGIPESLVDGVVDEQIRDLGLTKYRDKLTRGLSGGNKRKVSTGIALLGRPRVVFLDEPSTGVDPSSRRKMWDVIARVCAPESGADGDDDGAASVVLTTHSMEECEALCSRVGILVSGRLKCLGSVEHLKQKFGRGYTVEVTLRAALSSSEDGDNSEFEQLTTQVRAALISSRVSKSSLSHHSSWRASQQLGTTSMTTRGEDTIAAADVKQISALLGDDVRGARILDGTGTGWLLSSMLRAQGAVSVDAFCAWWVAETRSEELQSFFQNQFPGSVLVEQQDEHFRFQVPKRQAEAADLLRPADIFRALEEAREQLHVSEYGVSDTSLEHIFNSMAAQQDEEKGVAHGMMMPQ